MGTSSAPFVYVMSWRDEMPTKVGSSRDPKARAATIKCTQQLPKLTVRRQWNCGRYAGRIESILHRKLRAAAFGGEWYALPHAELCRYVDKVMKRLPTVAMQFLYEHPGTDRLKASDMVRRINDAIDAVCAEVTPIAEPAQMPECYYAVMYPDMPRA